MKKNPNTESIVNTLVSASDPEQVKALYAQWVQTYDDDLDGFGYVAPTIGVDLLSRCIADKQSLILDAGCGTGQVGVLLTKLGYTTLHGSDFSNEMLEKARAQDCYKKLDNADFSKSINVDVATYDAVISIGVYTKRFKQHFINEMIRIVRPGGYFVFSCRELYFDEVMSSVTELLRDKTISTLTVDFNDYMIGQAASAYYVAIKKSTQ